MKSEAAELPGLPFADGEIGLPKTGVARLADLARAMLARRPRADEIRRRDESRAMRRLLAIADELAPRFGLRYTSIEPESVVLRADDDAPPEEIANDYVFVFAGGVPPFGFLQRVRLQRKNFSPPDFRHREKLFADTFVSHFTDQRAAETAHNHQPDRPTSQCADGEHDQTTRNRASFDAAFLTVVCVQFALYIFFQRG